LDILAGALVGIGLVALFGNFLFSSGMAVGLLNSVQRTLVERPFFLVFVGLVFVAGGLLAAFIVPAENIRLKESVNLDQDMVKFAKRLSRLEALKRQGNLVGDVYDKLYEEYLTSLRSALEKEK
jgi:hypothetical protein